MAGHYLLSYVVTNSVFPTYKVNDLPRATKSYNKKKLDWFNIKINEVTLSRR